jgi:hypothetical protein
MASKRIIKELLGAFARRARAREASSRDARARREDRRGIARPTRSDADAAWDARDAVPRRARARKDATQYPASRGSARARAERARGAASSSTTRLGLTDVFALRSIRKRVRSRADD